MNTIIQSTVDTLSTKENRIKCASMVDVLRSGLFGVYHFRIKDLEFEQIHVGQGRRYSFKFWVMRKNGKEYRIPYKYVMYLTFKRCGLMS